MKKVLMHASVASMIYKFNMNNIKILEELGYKVEVACNFGKENPISHEEINQFKRILDEKNIKYYDVCCPRSLFAIKKMYIAYRQLKQVAKEENYNLVHTQSPIGGVVCRLAFRKARKQGTKVIYQAHGFHFYKGAPLINWLLFYPIEKICSYFTDLLITINREDYKLAKNKMNANQVQYVPGVGINLQRFECANVDKRKKKLELNLPEDAIILFSVGELNKNKNHQVVIKALAEVKNEKIHYCIAGKGEEKDTLLQLASSLGLQNNIHLIGFRTDVKELYHISDYFVFPSFREGLSVSLMEAMASGLPCAVSRIRGNVDLIDEEGGTMFDPGSVSECAVAIQNLLNSNTKVMKKNNMNKVQEFSINSVAEKMRVIYEE